MPQEVQDKCRKIQAKVSAQLTGLTDDLDTEIQQWQAQRSLERLGSFAN